MMLPLCLEASTGDDLACIPHFSTISLSAHARACFHVEHVDDACNIPEITLFNMRNQESEDPVAALTETCLDAVLGAIGRLSIISRAKYGSLPRGVAQMEDGVGNLTISPSPAE